MMLAEQVKQAGVVGAGGAGFPTHVKISARVDTVIANGAECEPLLASDKVLMYRHAADVMEGLRMLKQATGARRAVFATKRPYKRVLDLARREGAGIEIFELEDFYPAGDEQILVKEVTGRVVPETGIPLDVGVVVQNVGTLKAIKDATRGRPFTHRYVTITGAVQRPGVYYLPVGTPVWWAVGLAGVRFEDYMVINGGPMMGRVVTDPQEGVTKTTSGLICLPRDNELARRYTRDTSHWLKIALSACTQCSRCTELCPRHLLGHAIFPHKAMRTVAGGEVTPMETVMAAFLCSQCGVCELYACPMDLSPRQVFAVLRQELVQQGVRFPKTGQKPVVRDTYDWSKVPKHRIMERLDIEQYDRALDFVRHKGMPPMLNIALKQHVGAPAKPVVGRGMRVRAGDVIGEIPADALGARIHAPVDGLVSFVDDRKVVMEV